MEKNRLYVICSILVPGLKKMLENSLAAIPTTANAVAMKTRKTLQ